jgi:TetR/AcrR family transcriptional repressor of nem operon
VADRLERCERLGSLRAISAFLTEIMERSLADPERKGCMLVNAAFDVAPHDREFRVVVAAVLAWIEAFFARCVEAGQRNGEIVSPQPARDLASHLLVVLVGLRVLARVRPERAVLEGAVRSALALLDAA